MVAAALPEIITLAEPDLSAEQLQALQGRKVLLIDDDVRNLFAVTSLLERSNMKVISATTAQEGLDALKEDPSVEVVLMDIMLPGIDGFQATRQIKAMPPYAKLPIVALTAKAMPGDRRNAWRPAARPSCPSPSTPTACSPPSPGW
jgi:CheY-like chemotaxis protein